MMRSLPLRLPSLCHAVRMTGAAMLALPLLANPAQANSDVQVGVHGHVAPRCWVANPATRQAPMEMSGSKIAAICNQATPLIQSTMRALDTDDTMAIRTEAAGTAQQFGGRAAREITISPQP